MEWLSPHNFLKSNGCLHTTFEIGWLPTHKFLTGYYTSKPTWLSYAENADTTRIQKVSRDTLTIFVKSMSIPKVSRDTFSWIGSNFRVVLREAILVLVQFRGERVFPGKHDSEQCDQVPKPVLLLAKRNGCDISWSNHSTCLKARFPFRELVHGFWIYRARKHRTEIDLYFL